MTTKEEVNDILKQVLREDMVPIWWGLEIAGLGKAKPNEIWEREPDRILEYVKGYLDESS
jgi:hypothetical protein